MDLKARAFALHHRLLTVDTHCDTAENLLRPSWNIGLRHEPGQVESGFQDLIRMQEGGLSASFFAAFIAQQALTPEGYGKAAREAEALLEAILRMFQEHSSLCEQCFTPADIRRVCATGKRAIVMGLENAYPLGTNLSHVDALHQKGVRYITLCHISDNAVCCSSTEKTPRVDTGLTAFGEEVVRRMNDLGIMVDVSHVSDKTFFDVLALSKAPVLASHSSARSVCDHPRNLTDEQLRALKHHGGVAQMCIYGPYIKHPLPNSLKHQAEEDLRNRINAAGGWPNIQDPALRLAFDTEWKSFVFRYREELPTISDAVDHLDHMVNVAGIDHVGIGTDFDGGGALQDCYDVTHLVGITEELLRRGYSEGDIAKIWGENTLRVMEAAQEAAKTQLS